jgi:V/A-type H+-transporting ATPase subunit I
MLKARPMKRLLIAGLKAQMEAAIHEIYRHRLFHVQDFTEGQGEDYQGFRMGVPFGGAGEAAAQLVVVRGLLSALGVSREMAGPRAKMPASEVRGLMERHLPPLRNEVENVITKRRSVLEADQKKFEDLLGEMEPFTVAPLDMDLYHGYDNLGVFVGRIARDVDIPGPHEKFFTDAVPGKFIAVFAPKENRGRVERVLLDSNFKALPVPRVEGSPGELSRGYQVKLAEIKGELAGVEEKAAGLGKAHADWLLASEELLTADVEQKEIPLRFATTEQTFVAEGWVPAPEAPGFVSALNSALAGKVFVTELPSEEVPDQPPVEYDNPSFARPAELFMDIYSRPRYTEIDPTILLSIVFPIFFGLIVGDVGYGLLFLVMAYGLGRFLSGPEGRMLLANLRNAAIASIVFGLLFSEFLGYALPWPPVIFSRHLNIGGEAGGHGPAIPQLMVLSIWIGVAHITLGRIFGIINHARQDHGRHRTMAVLANLGWLCVMWGILVVIWSNFALPLMPDLTGAPAAVAGLNLAGILGAVILVAGVAFIARDSVLEVVELPTIISHVLSYARLVAVGLSSVAIALVVNFIAIGMMIEPQLEHITAAGIVVIIAGVVTFLIGHAGNLALGLLGGGLHSIRLHYVEWFTKFYKGGGEKYQPLGMERVFTEE